MGINPEMTRSNEEIEKEEMAAEAEQKARGYTYKDSRLSNVAEKESPEKSLEERVEDSRMAIEAFNEKDRDEFLKKKMAEFDKKVLSATAKVAENPDATTEDKEKAEGVAREAVDRAGEIKKETEEKINKIVGDDNKKMTEKKLTWEANDEDVAEEDPRGSQWHITPATEEAVNAYAETQQVDGSEESLGDSAKEAHKGVKMNEDGTWEDGIETGDITSPQEGSAGVENLKFGNEGKLWAQMGPKERGDAVCQAALGALNNIAADQKPSLWERMKAGWSSLKESAKEKWDGAKAKLLGEEFAGAREKAKNTWGFLKERLKGVATFGFWEFHQAEKFRAATRDIGKDVNAQARLIEEEEMLSKEEALKEAEEMRTAFEGIDRDPSAQEYEMMSRGISGEKMVYNERAVENIIQDATKSLEERLEKRSLLQGYRSADVGKKVLTPEKIALLQERMRHQLNGMRNGQVRGDFKQYAQLMRRNLDPGWWKRYIYGGVEVALDGLALHLVTAPGAAEAVPAHAGTGTKLLPPPAELVEPMHRTIWQTTAEFLKAHGVANPTNAQIMEGSKLVAQGNHIGVNVWNIPGNPLDVHMRAAYLLKMKPLVDGLTRIAAM